MRIAPLISLALSILVGIAAVFFGRGWLNTEAGASNPPSVIVQDVETQKLLVADKLIERGDLLSSEAFREVDWPLAHMPEGAISEVSAILNADGSFPYALGLMVPGEPLLGAKLSHTAVRDTLAALIEPGFRAVSVEVSDASGVAGFVLPDHRVDVNVFTEKRNNDGEPIPHVETLLEDIRVLAVDQFFQENLEGAALARTVTLQVTPEQSKVLGLANEKFGIGLVLRPQGEAPLQIGLPKPAPKPVIARAPVKIVPKFANIRVIQGDEEQTVSAPVARSADTNGVTDQ